MPNGVQIGKVSEQTGLSIDAIRFYEKQRLLDRPPRTEGGFRLFGREDIERIRFIGSVQQLGFSLPEIRELLVLQRDQGESCSHVRELLRGKLSTVREKVRELRALEQQLVKNLRKCGGNLKSKGNCQAEECPVLKEASGGGPDEN
ncbi:MAG: heavy metal-responsive transcriptional regulator [Acidobacteriia bacterium]|nr:heavy metal-responsive transcriptional regulator [Terriglobia bacterium]